ncbi:MAG: RNA 2'-phosphotransferase [Desulfatitalea sp. BRH_c12]|nr:MAG: RNA 2'-phosphotransferase [Desulfatitalea sp. BRH_c12]
MNLTKLSKIVSHALRHEPWLYELELDNQGWVNIEDLISALQGQQSEWKDLNQADIVKMINTSSKQRHEVKNNRIRALYGHSLPGKLQKRKAVPPEQLFHGTAPSMVSRIMETGLRPMSRQYVHLSIDTVMANKVGSRKAKDPLILLINAKEAHESGVVFYAGNDAVWLADTVPPEFIAIYTAS